MAKLRSYQIWSQLKLTATSLAETSSGNGVAHVALSFLNAEGLPTERGKHRIFANVPATDLKPPESFPRIELQKVLFSMDVVEGKLRPPLKRSNTSTTLENYAPLQAELDAGEHQLIGTMSPWDTTDGVEVIDDETLAKTTSMSRKRKRCENSAHARTSSSQHGRSRKWPFAVSDWRPTRPPGPSKEQMAEVKTMVDGAMRLSVCGSMKSSAGLKVKANTISVGLGDVAPILWRPGYLGASNNDLFKGTWLTK